MRHMEMSAKGQKRTLHSLFDHLVGSGEQRRRNGKAKRLRGLEVDGQLVFGRRLDWHVGWLLALEDAIDISRGVSHRLLNVRSVAQQSAVHSVVTEGVN